ncbi:hypothetical protein, partial [uncultured Bacteroides sp.]|uniref:hypothetical protein n=1 Tax=uncultured Bacteroides sp. TaxID=162156 RepID=UPI0025B6A099
WQPFLLLSSLRRYLFKLNKFLGTSDWSQMLKMRLFAIATVKMIRFDWSIQKLSLTLHHKHNQQLQQR